MKQALSGAINVCGNKEFKIKYEDLKNYIGYEDIFYEMYLIPTLKDLNLEHRFEKEFIILKKKKES